jgi:hypothetical protein
LYFILSRIANWPDSDFGSSSNEFGASQVSYLESSPYYSRAYLCECCSHCCSCGAAALSSSGSVSCSDSYASLAAPSSSVTKRLACGPPGWDGPAYYADFPHSSRASVYGIERNSLNSASLNSFNAYCCSKGLALAAGECAGRLLGSSPRYHHSTKS